MSVNTKTTIMLGISIIAIIIAVAAVMFSLQNMVIINNQIAIQKSYQNKTVTNASHYRGEKREFWLSDSEIPGFNETQMGMPKDIYSMTTISVFKGDQVIIHFFNIEKPGGDNHSFTIFDKPYNLNSVVTPGQNTTITLDANTTGVFTYYCTFHVPTMRGQLVVQPPPY